MRIRLRVTGWDRWQDRFEDAQSDVDTELRRVINRAALNVKTTWAARWAPSRHLPHIGASVSYDVTGASPHWKAAIGPDKLRAQGPLGTIIEDANGRARNRATHAGNRAGAAEEPRFESSVANAGEKGAGG